MRDFKKEAREKQQNKNKKNKNVALPGWGNWAGNTSQGKIKAKNKRLYSHVLMFTFSNGK